ncbi:MAG: hypothetical protein HY237_06850 [Acidobacteria bacterium]|nr:hypothetical protein [Acidobacteriota bacterium]
MRKSLTLMLGIFLGSWLSALAQTSPTPAKPGTQRAAPARRPAETDHSAPVVFLSGRPLDPRPGLSTGLIGATYRRDLASGNFSSLQVVKNPFVRQVRMGFAQLWSGRLQLDGFGSTRRMDSALRFSSGWGGFPGFRAATADSPGLRVLGAERTYGLTMTIRLGRDAATGRRAEGCRCLGWMAGLLR